MPNKNYQKGYRFELRVKKFLEKHGWYVIRSAGSKGIFDLVALQTPKHKNFTTTTIDVALIQCKYNIIPSRKERDTILKIHKDLGIVGVSIAYAKPNGKIWFLSPMTLKEQSWLP